VIHLQTFYQPVQERGPTLARFNQDRMGKGADDMPGNRGRTIPATDIEVPTLGPKAVGYPEWFRHEATNQFCSGQTGQVHGLIPMLQLIDVTG
jgi:hypothetical protein